jgi:hypothetical protein
MLQPSPTQNIDALLTHLASRPGHDEVKADFRQVLVEEFGVELGALDFERLNRVLAQRKQAAQAVSTRLLFAAQQAYRFRPVFTLAACLPPSMSRISASACAREPPKSRPVVSNP